MQNLQMKHFSHYVVNDKCKMMELSLQPITNRNHSIGTERQDLTRLQFVYLFAVVEQGPFMAGGRLKKRLGGRTKWAIE
jgi:hypothetical protein